jgi:hypothetical protein
MAGGVEVGAGGVPRITIYPPDQPGLGGWAPWSPPQPEQPPMPSPQPADAATAQQQSQAGPGGWAAWTPPPPSPAPGREIGTGEAALRGALEAVTFGSSPAVEGLSAASGLQQTEAPDAGTQVAPGQADAFSQTPGTDLWNIAKGVASPFIGAARLAGNAVSSQPDQSIVDAYNQAREAALAEQQAAQQQHPYAFLGGQLAGSLALPIAGDVQAVGTGARLAKAMTAGAIGGGAYGAGGAASEGGGLTDMMKGAAGGAAAGLVLGGGGAAALEGAGALGSKVVSAVRGHRDIDAEAARRIVSTMRSDYNKEGPQFTPDEVRYIRSAGAPAAIVDSGGERTMAMARSAANTSPEARHALTRLADRRYEQQAERIGGAINNLSGSGRLDVDALHAMARRANAPLYKRAQFAAERRFNNGIWSPRLEQLLSSEAVPAAMQKAMKSGRDRAVLEGMGAFNPKVSFHNGILRTNAKGGVPSFPDLQLWDYTQRSLRDAAVEAQRAGRNEEAGAKFGLHRALLDEIDRLVPEFKTARGVARMFKGAENAHDAGRAFVTADVNGAEKLLRKMNRADRELFARGFATELADRVMKIGDRRNVLTSAFLDAPAARAKIELALGPQRARELETLLRAEDTLDRLRRTLGNSTTARQLAEMGLAGGAVATFEGLKEHEFNPAHVIAAALTIGAARHGAKVIDEKVARRVGEMLASSDPAVLAKGINIVASRPVLMDALRKATNVSMRQILNYLHPSGVAAAGLAAFDHFEPEAPKQDTPSDYYDDAQAQGAR